MPSPKKPVAPTTPQAAPARRPSAGGGKPMATHRAAKLGRKQLAEMLGCDPTTLDAMKRRGARGFYEGGTINLGELFQSVRELEREAGRQEASRAGADGNGVEMKDVLLEREKLKWYADQRKFATDELGLFVLKSVAEQNYGRALGRVVEFHRMFPSVLMPIIRRNQELPDKQLQEEIAKTCDDLIREMSVDRIINGTEDDDLEEAVNGAAGGKTDDEEDAEEDDGMAGLDEETLADYLEEDE